MTNELKPFLYISECGEESEDTEMLLRESVDFSSVVSGATTIVGSTLAVQTLGTLLSPVNSDEDQSNKNISNGLVKALAKASGLMVKTFNEAKNLDCFFPPGHPLPGKTYRLHPLAELPNSNKSNVYIPEETYDDVLYAEREAELIRLLVALGATGISIRKVGAGYRQKNSATSSSASVDTPVVSASGEIKDQSDSSADQYMSDTRSFVLEGLEWNKSDCLDLSPFGWLLYEPSWGAMVNAREMGGCLKASIELKKQTSFSLRRSFQGSMSAGGYGCSAEAKKEIDKASYAENMDSYIVEAEFGKRTE
ncbi:protein of unknown function [Pseudodesulfovibrio profundus]|uniref:Uncharacterized protein n=1 Tax=Pseudodesulfovibrio profundus TaxID=57320 RepID=A0A2C8FE26_9BACT|nr:hypothetical protein [Pseudodesulfovibrio profundus]SOB60144.1 protein of unknown function [Pseudodesulfovibrio profundus]